MTPILVLSSLLATLVAPTSPACQPDDKFIQSCCTSSARSQPQDPNVAKAYKILHDVWQASEQTSYYARMSLPVELAPYHPDLLLKLAAGKDSTVHDHVLMGAIAALAEANPALAGTWGPSQLAKIQGSQEYCIAAAAVGLSLAAKDREAASRVFLSAMERSKVPQAESTVPPGFVKVMLAVLSAKLKLPNTEGLLAEAVAEAKKTGDQADDLITAFAGFMGKSSPVLASKTAAGLSVANRLRALTSAIPLVAQYDLAAAQAMLDELGKLDDAGHAHGHAAKYVVSALGKTDPDAALKVARTVLSAMERPMALALAAMWRKEDAAAVFREAVALVAAGDAAPARIARIAAIAFDKDQDLGKELFAEARKQLDPAGSGGRSRCEFAFFYARVDPMEAGRLAEEELLARQKDVAGLNKGWNLLVPCLALAAVNIDRALEVARTIPGDAGFDGQRKIAQYILAQVSVRKSMPFDRWCASDSWIPGTPSGW